MATRTRWSDNDRNFGPFTYARDNRGYRPVAVMLDSGDDDDYPGCRLRFSAFGHTLIIALPPIVRPWRQKVTAGWDADTIARLGRDWYWDTHSREFGFSFIGKALHVHYGRQTHDSTTDRSKCFFLPWLNWRHVRHSLYGLDGSLFADMPECARLGSPDYDEDRRLRETCPTVSFDFDDFDGERLAATTKIGEREWRLGTGYFKWLSLFRRPKIRRSLEIDFSGETGKRKCSWKGGTIGHSIDMRPDELHEAAFRRYCAAHDMTFVGSGER